MNLERRGVAADPAGAARAMTAALRTLEAAEVDSPAVWIAHGTARFDAAAAWDHGIALVRVADAASDEAAREVARAVGARLVTSVTDVAVGARGRGDGSRLATRFEVGLWPDEHVWLSLGADRDEPALTRRLDAFDQQLVDDPGPARRLVLAGLATHDAALSEPLVRAILHPLVLVEMTRLPAAFLALLQSAADLVTPEP